MRVTAENKPLQSGSSSGLSTIPDVSLMHSGPFPSTHTNYLLMTLINANSAGSVLHREVCPSAPGGAPPSPMRRGLPCGGSGDKGPGQGLITWRGRQQLQWKSAGRYRGGVEGILEHSVGVSFRTLIISMFEIFPRLKGQGTGTLWMIVFGSRYLAKGKHRAQTQQALSFTIAQGPVHMEEGPLSTIFIMGSFRLGGALPEMVPLLMSYAWCQKSMPTSKTP